MNQLNPFFAFTGGLIIFPIVLVIWTIFWKGCSLWIASKNNQKGWFVVLLILNTFGILEIVYIFFVAKKKWTDVKEIFGKTTSLNK